MIDWKCRDCGSILSVDNDDSLVFAALEHPCVPNPSWLRLMADDVKRWLDVARQQAAAPSDAGRSEGV